MNLWHHLARYFPGPWRRSLSAEAELTRCYRTHFGGHGGEREAQIVLADLANFTGFYRVNAIDVPSDMRAYSDGQRSVYGYVFKNLRMTDDEVRQLEEAARAEAIAASTEGQI